MATIVLLQLATTPAFAFSQINNRVIFSAISQTSEGSKEPKIKKVIEYYAITAGLIYGLAFTLTPEIITLVYGNTWKQSIPICQTILIYSYMAGFMSILGAYLLSINKSLDIARIDWFIVPFSLTSYVIGANIAGIQGVAIAVTSVMGFAASTWYLIAACRSSGANIKSFLNSAFIPTISIAIVMITIHIIPGIHNANIYLKVLILLGAYIAMLTLVSKGRLPFSLIKFMFHKSRFNI